MSLAPLASMAVDVQRLGVALAPNGSREESEGILNPASARGRDGTLYLYPRCVGPGNTSRIGLIEVTGDQPRYVRHGYALEPQEEYEKRTAAGGYGCEDPRVTYVTALDTYLMAYTAFGPDGPRIAVAQSRDALDWERLGPVDFSAVGRTGDDKDAAFFPDPVLSPGGVPSLAFYHRPMHRLSSIDGCAAAELLLARPPNEREATCIAYVPLTRVLRSRRALLRPTESAMVLEPGKGWGAVKNGAGTPPVRLGEGWLSLFHAVDASHGADGGCVGVRYGAGIVVHDPERPHVVRYRSPAPIMTPDTHEERIGVVSDVVFPTAIDRLDDGRSFDVYYGMADARIGRARLSLGVGVAERHAPTQTGAAAD